MKKLIFALLLTVTFNNSWGQAPEKMSYQAVIRSTSNQLVVSQTIGMRVSILQGSSSGTAVYVETQTPLSNANGLVSIEIGSGTLVSGSFNGIDWANGPYFIQTETDPTGGTSYSLTGTSELLSVPYALHAKTVEIEQDTTIWKLNSSNVYYNGGMVGIGTSSPESNLHVTGTVLSDGDFVSRNSLGGTPRYQLNRSGVLWESGINSSDNFFIGNSISSKLTINNTSGNVGIGTSNPTTKLRVQDGDISAGKTDGSELWLGDQFWHSSIKDTVLPTFGSSMVLRTQGTDKMVITGGTGRIGLGTMTPKEHFQIGDRWFFHDQTTKAIIYNYFWNGTNFEYATSNAASGIEFNSSNLGDVSIFTAPTGTAGTPVTGLINHRLYIKNNGNVGIGTQTPARTLHVNSVMRLEPINVAPSSPAKGDMYFDGILNKLRVYDGTTWQNCW